MKSPWTSPWNPIEIPRFPSFLRQGVWSAIAQGDTQPKESHLAVDRIIMGDCNYNN